MSFRKRLRSKSYSSRASNKFRYINEWGNIELESWISFPSQDEEVKSQLWEYSLNSIKQEPKEQLLYPFNNLKKREAKIFNKLSFQKQILSEFEGLQMESSRNGQSKLDAIWISDYYKKIGTLLLQFITIIITTNF